MRRMPPLLRVTSFFALCLLAGAGAMAAAAATDPWSIDSGKIDPATYHGEVLSNGMIGITSIPAPFGTGQILINGAYEALQPGDVSALVTSFNFLDLAFSIDGERIERLEQVSHFRQRLGLKDAVLTTTFEVKDQAAITTRLRALRHMPYSGLLEITVTAKRPITIAPLSRLATPPPPGPYEDPRQGLIDLKTYDRVIDAYAAPHSLPIRAARAKSQFGRHTIAAAQAFLFEVPWAAAPRVTHGTEGLSFTKELAAGITYHFALVGSTMTSAHVGDPLNEAQRLTTFAAVRGTQPLIGQHEREWAALWASDIRIEGDDEMQRDVRSMLYHLYASMGADLDYSIQTHGLSRSTSGSRGHVFWDAETYMLPALLALKPQLARSIVEYRFARLPAARKKAVAYGYRGAMFPWESVASGEEDTPSDNLTSILEQHVTALVGLAAWDYFRVTQDRQWLRARGYPLIKETADFWVSRVTRSGPGRYDILHIIGPNEHMRNVHNNAFTNAAAKENLAAAIKAATVLGLAPDPQWHAVRAHIPIPRFADGVIRLHDTYEGREPVAFADATLMAYPLQVLTDPPILRRNLEYYASRYMSEQTQGMTRSVLAIVYQRLGETDKAYEILKEALASVKRPPFGALAEYNTSHNPYFLTGAGGFLQTLLYGFGGLEITEQGLVHKPAKLPKHWKSLTLTGIGPERRTYRVQ